MIDSRIAAIAAHRFPGRGVVVCTEHDPLGSRVGRDKWAVFFGSEESVPEWIDVGLSAALYTVKMREECGGDESVTIEAASLDDACRQAEEMTREWVADGDYGIEGASVTAYYTIIDEEGDEIEDGSVIVEITPDEEALCRRAGGDTDCDHEWSSEGEGGCDENPGVWSTGGTSMVFASHCIHCGIRRVERTWGSQRNPGQHDTVEFELPSNE